MVKHRLQLNEEVTQTSISSAPSTKHQVFFCGTLLITIDFVELSRPPILEQSYAEPDVAEDQNMKLRIKILLPPSVLVELFLW